MKVRADQELCIAAAGCVAVAPAVFTLNDEGFVEDKVFDVPEGEEVAAEDAILMCPSHALTVEEE